MHNSAIENPAYKAGASQRFLCVEDDFAHFAGPSRCRIGLLFWAFKGKKPKITHQIFSVKALF